MKHTSILSFVVTALVVGLMGQAAQAATVGYWRFEEGVADANATGNGTVLDSSGNGLHGTPVNNPVYRSDVGSASVPHTGASNTRSIQMNLSSSAVLLGDISQLQLTHSLTLEAYIRPSSSTKMGAVIFRGDNRPAQDPYSLTVNHASDTVNQGSNIGFWINDSSGSRAYVSAPLPALNQWCHVAGTLDDATGRMCIYINGDLVASKTTTLRPLGALSPTNSPGVTIGNVTAPLYDQSFAGMIDEVRISDRALLPEELLISQGAPWVEAGPDQTVWLSAVANLAGTVSDDGLPNPPGTTACIWSVTSGPGPVSFADASAPETTASFSTTGIYVLRLSASDMAVSAYDEVTITVAPGLNAGPDRVLPLAMTANLAGAVSDDGLPHPSLLLTWSMTSGPAPVTFADAHAAVTSVDFEKFGTYVLCLTASDTGFSLSDDLTIVVHPNALGDFNGDGHADGLDFLIWQVNYAPGVVGKTRQQGDANGDGKVDGLDFLLWQTDFGYEH